MNYRTHFFIRICISHTLFSKGLIFLWCLRDEWRHKHTAILTKLLLLTIARSVIPISTSSTSWLGLLNWRSQAASYSGLPFTKWLNGLRHLSIIFHNVHDLSVLPLIYTGASLIDGSIKGQYRTLIPPPYFSKCPPMDIFLTSLSIPLTHTSYKYAQGQQHQKYKKNYLNNSKNNKILKQLESDLLTR